MDFSRISEIDLLEFLADYPNIPIRGGNIVEQATHLFNVLNQQPNPIFPEIIQDVINTNRLKFQFPPQKYTFDQIRALKSEEVKEFARILNLPATTTRGKIYRYLYLMDRIQNSLSGDILLTGPILESVCSNLNFNEALNLQVSHALKNISCELKINDPDGYVDSLPGITQDTKILNDVIQKHGSHTMIDAIINPEDFQYADGESVPIDDRIRLFEILLSRFNDPSFLIDTAVGQEMSYPFFDLLLRYGANFGTKKNQELGQTLIFNKMLDSNGLPFIQRLLEQGVNPNFTVDTRDYSDLVHQVNVNLPPRLSLLQMAILLNQSEEAHKYPQLPQIIQLLEQYGASL